MIEKLVAYLLQSWEDLDVAVAGLSAEQATQRAANQSSIAWTVGHIVPEQTDWGKRFL